MAEKIDPTWLAYSFDVAADSDRLDAGVARIAAHYGELVRYPLATHQRAGPHRGLVVLADAEPNCGWRHFEAEADLALGTAYVPPGWERLTGSLPIGVAGIPLARAILSDPLRAVAELRSPMVAGALDKAADRLVVVNDPIGAGRLFETTLAQGRIWSNRAAAGKLFAGAPIEPDREGWELLAAVGWFCGPFTPIKDVRKVAAGSVIEAGADGVSVRESDVIGGLVAGGDDLASIYAEAASQAVDQVRFADSLWRERPVIHLSGGRDSRLVAAAALSAGVDAVFRTSDNTPGEADVARQLVSVAPRPMEHVVAHTEEGDGPQTPLLDRTLRSQLLHDGMRHASKARRDVNLPRSRASRATLAGWGGEIAHAFYYQDARQLRKVRRKGRDQVMTRLLESSRKKHGAASAAAYERARVEFDSIVAKGEAFGLAGPDLLNWFYLVERFVHRFEIGADSQGVSVYATPGFIRLAFAISPEERISMSAHAELTARLVPEWKDVPFFVPQPGPRPALRRARLWEAPGDAEVVAALIAEGGAWTELFREERIKEMWKELRSGGGFADWETVFERLVFRAAFGRFQARIAERSALGEPLFR